MDAISLLEKRRVQLNDWGLLDDISFNIFCRLPPKTVGQLKIVCKKWHTLLSLPLFCMFYGRHSMFRNIKNIIFLVDSSIWSLNTTQVGELGHLVTNEINNPFPLVHGVQENYYWAGSADGVICVVVCSRENGVLCDIIVLWNPLTKELRNIPSPQTPDWRRLSPLESITCWFGFVESVRDYVIFVLRRTNRFILAMSEMKWTEFPNPNLFIYQDEGPEPNSSRNQGSRLFLLEGRFLYASFGYSLIVKFDLIDNNYVRFPFLEDGEKTRVYLGEDYDIAEAAIGIKLGKLHSIRIYQEAEQVGEEVEQVGEEVVQVGQEVEQVGEEVEQVGQEVEQVGEEVEQVGQEVEQVGNEQVVEAEEEIPKIEWLVEEWEFDRGLWKLRHSVHLGQQTPWLFPAIHPRLVGYTFDDKILVGAEDLVVVDPNEQDQDLRVIRVDNDTCAIFTTVRIDTSLSPYWL